jgi:hypothetical protein
MVMPLQSYFSIGFVSSHNLVLDQVLHNYIYIIIHAFKLQVRLKLGLNHLSDPTSLNFSLGWTDSVR